MEIKKGILILVLSLTLIIAGCGGQNSAAKGPSAEVFTLSDDCRDKPTNEKKQCCRERCSQFCGEEGYNVQKIKAFSTSCGCWCSENEG